MREDVMSSCVLVLAVLAAVVWGIVLVRRVRRMAGNWGKALTTDRVSGSVVTVIDSIRNVAKLSVMRVIDADLRTEIARDDKGNERARVEFQYAGQSDLYVDLSKASFKSAVPGRYDVILPGLSIADPLEIPLKTDEEKFQLGSGICWREEFRQSSHKFRSKDYEESLLRKLPKLKAAAIRETCKAQDILDKAKARAEYYLRFMLTPLVKDPERDIDFHWERDLAAVPQEPA